MDDFTKAYIDCALWSSTDDEGVPLDDSFGIEDIAPETLEQITNECKDFQESFADLLEQAFARGLGAEQAGHDFWLTRNHHGTGFWDRGLGEIGKHLTDMAHPYGSFDLYIGDDEKIHGQ